MKGGKTPLGYTIVEVLIVLAVSGMMFVIAASFINGKQQKTSFTAGVNETASQIQDLIEQVTDGQYSDVPINCKSPGGNVIFPGAGSSAQGANSQCIFLGKFLHFSVHGNPETYEIISAAGSRLDGSGKPISDVTNSGASYIPNLTVTKIVPQRLDITSVKSNGGAILSFEVGFVQSLATSDGAGGISNGAHAPPRLYYVDTVGQNAPTAAAENMIKQNKLFPADDVVLCVTDGGRYANISIGSRNNQLSVGVKILGAAC